MKGFVRWIVMLGVLGAVIPSASAQRMDIYEAAKSGNLLGRGAVVGASESTLWVLAPDSLVSFDFESGIRRSRPVPDLFARLGIDTRPSSNSMSVTRDGTSAWIWDGSVGSVYRIGLTGTTLDAFERYSSRTQFKHAGGLDPIHERPLAYSGYGYYRAKDFMLSFSDTLNTWQEVPYAPEGGPAPRMSSIMVYGWDAAKVAVSGGSEALPNAFPPEYVRDVTDYWVFDFTSSAWTRHDTPDGFDCALRRQEVQLGYTPVSLAFGAAFVVVSDDCAGGGASAGDVVMWLPGEAEFRHLGRVPADRPEGYYVAMVYADTVKSALQVVYWRPDRDRDFTEWEQFWVSIPIGMNTSPASPSRWFLVLFVLPLLVWYWRRKQPTDVSDLVTIHRSARGTEVELIFRERREVFGLSVVAVIMFDYLSTVKTEKGNILDSDELMDFFRKSYPDSDSARVMKNRGVDEFNRMCDSVGAGHLLTRRRRPEDARRFNYEFRRTLSLDVVPVAIS